MDNAIAAVQALALALADLDGDRTACAPAEDSRAGQVIAKARALVAQAAPSLLEASGFSQPVGTWREKLEWATQPRATRDYRVVYLVEHECRLALDAVARVEEQ